MPYRPAKVGDEFGPSWTTHWFRVRAAVPREWDGLGPLMFRWGLGGGQRVGAWREGTGPGPWAR